MSARAAWRLESLGFTAVRRYTPGKADWLASGLPTVGKLAQVRRARDVARRDVPTCGLAERVGAVRERVRAAGWDQCIVVNEQRIVLGRLREQALGGDDGANAEAVMEAGPTTIRPDAALDALGKRMRERRVGSMVVSTSDGVLVGVLRRDDVESALK